MSETYGTFSKAYVEAMRLRLSALEAENKGLSARVAELEAREKQAREDEAWANGDGLVELEPVTSGWVASTLDGLHSINATAPTIHGALRALRDRLEAKP